MPWSHPRPMAPSPPPPPAAADSSRVQSAEVRQSQGTGDASAAGPARRLKQPVCVTGKQHVAGGGCDSRQWSMLNVLSSHYQDAAALHTRWALPSQQCNCPHTTHMLRHDTHHAPAMKESLRACDDITQPTMRLHLTCKTKNSGWSNPDGRTMKQKRCVWNCLRPVLVLNAVRSHTTPKTNTLCPAGLSGMNG